jgi:hypothetical protein
MLYFIGHSAPATASDRQTARKKNLAPAHPSEVRIRSYREEQTKAVRSESSTIGVANRPLSVLGRTRYQHFPCQKTVGWQGLAWLVYTQLYMRNFRQFAQGY